MLANSTSPLGRSTGAAWHETYVNSPGHLEAICVNMPSLGLGMALCTVPVGRGSSTAQQRMRATATA